MSLSLLVVTKGHPFEREPFEAIFAEMEGVEFTHVEHPEAVRWLAPERAVDFDTVLFYDMPGIDFADGGPVYGEPPAELPGYFEALTAAGKGLVFLHHAIAGWPAWPAYGEMVGGRFCYTPQLVRGVEVPDSGYRHQVDHEIRVLRDHPVTAGLPATFRMTDELYLYQVFDDRIEPLLASGHDFSRDNFYSAANVVLRGQMYSNEGWEHPVGSNLVGWTRHEGNSRLVYLQGGDDPVAYADPNYRRLVRNAVFWVAEAD